jgi:hypothetical protein
MLMQHVPLRYNAKREKKTLSIFPIDDDDVVYPRNHQRTRHHDRAQPDCVKDVGDATATLFSSSVAPFNLKATVASNAGAGGLQ